MSDRPIVLASASPRRKALLAQVGLDVETMPVDVDEAARPGEAPDAYVTRLAREKARTAAERVGKECIVIGADTAVVIDGEILGKPPGRRAYLAMMRRLSGRSHEVLTAVAVSAADELRHTLSRTTVHFRAITAREMDAYWECGEPQDKAGGYGIQGVGGIFVARLEGSYSGVVGLPLAEMAQMLTELGVDLWKYCADEAKATPWAKTSSSTSTTSKPG